MRTLLACPDRSLVRIWIKLFKYNLERLRFPIKYQTFIGACLVLILSFLTLVVPVSAHTTYSLPDVAPNEIDEAILGIVPLRFLPGKPLYFLITFKESVQRFFQPSSASRAQFDLVLSGKRLKESYLLLENADVRRSSDALDRYGDRLIKMVEQLEKARSQNQEVAPLVDRVAGELENHEILLSAINNKWEGQEDGYDFDSNFADAIFGFSKVVSAINNMKPGLKDRYIIDIEEDTNNNVVPYITPPELFEASPSVRPKRIIY